MPPAPWRSELDRSITATGRGAFAWRRSAAALFGLDAFDRPTGGPEVAVMYPRKGRLAVPRLKNLTPADIVVVDGTPATCVGRLLLDLGTACGPDLVERAAESALRQRLCTDAGLRALARTPCARGAGVLRLVMDRRPVGAPATGSDLETSMVQLCRAAALPEPQRQLPQMLGRRYRIDLAWAEWRVAAEVDGRETHDGRDRDAFVNDRRRQNRMVIAGWLLLRFTRDDIVEAPEATVATVVAALRHQGWGG